MIHVFEDAAGGYVVDTCLKCGRLLRQFEDKSWEKHTCSLSLREKTLNESDNEVYLDNHSFEELKQRSPNNQTPRDSNNPNQPSNSNGFNWTPLLIGAVVLAVIGLGAYFFFKNKKNKAIK